MNIKKIGEWNMARAAVQRQGMRAHRAMGKATKQEAHLMRGMIVRAFVSGGRSNGVNWPKLQPATIAAKKSSKPLIDSGDLRNSVVVVTDGNDAFVGVTSKSRSSDGKSLANIAAVHEYGKTIVQKRGDSVVIIKIPERSFLRSTVTRHFKPAIAKQRFLARVAIAMGRGWATQAPTTGAAMAKAGKADAKAKLPTSLPKPSKPKKQPQGGSGGKFI